MGVDTQGFRRALGSFATGVTIVTTRCAGGSMQGLTANSFNSVSLDPPLVLVSLARGLGCFEHFKSCPTFAINILAADQRDLSNRFASRGLDKWRTVDFDQGVLGVPLIKPRLAVFECRSYARYDGGDHEILLGEVIRFEVDDTARPLIYFRGNYNEIVAA